jgi:hypothetical protein
MRKRANNKFIVSIGVLLCLCSIVDAKKLRPKIGFDQVKDIAHRFAIDNTGADYVVANSYMYLGSVNEEDKKHIAYKNAFELYLLKCKGDRLTVQQVDNFGWHKQRRVTNKAVKEYLDAHYKTMKLEQMRNFIDSTYDSTSGKILYKFVSANHQLVRSISIYSGADSLYYEYPVTDYSRNKANLSTYQYGFLEVLNCVKDRYMRAH